MLAAALMVSSILAVLQPAMTAEASHFRAGQIDWSPAGGNAIQFTIADAFRRDGYACLNIQTFASKPCTAAIVVLRVDNPAGYAPNPGHAGTGVPVATVP